jgi:hypothetical protein
MGVACVVSTALKSAFAAAMESVQGLDRQYVIPGLKKVIRKIIKGYTTRDERITSQLASLNEVFQLVFPGTQVEVVPAFAHFLREDCYKLAIAIKKTNHDQHYSIHDLSDGEKEGTLPAPATGINTAKEFLAPLNYMSDLLRVTTSVLPGVASA